MYDEGKGVKQDYHRAVAFYVKACDAGNATSCGTLGFMYSKGSGVQKNPETARKLISKACSMGSDFYCMYMKTMQ